MENENSEGLNFQYAFGHNSVNMQ